MKKIILFSIIIVFSGILKAQTFPYLNASTGNRNQYIIDSDSNIIMFHQNQIEKLDNHFNPIWVKKYIGLDFYSLLLSKTGSIYFIAADTTNYTYFNLQYNRRIGKIDSQGNLAWEKTITHSTLSNINLRQLFLDRNNHLIVSGEGTNTNGSGIILKLDTLGGPIYTKTIKNPNSFDFQNVTILNDSLGFYKFVSYEWFTFGATNSFFTYAETGDTIFSQSHFNNPVNSKNYFCKDPSYYKSKYDSSIYLINEQMASNSATYTLSVVKYKNNKTLWNKTFPSFNGPYFINSFDEDEQKNVVFTISPKNGPGGYHTNYTNYCFKIDSNGYHNGTYNVLLNYSWWPPVSLFESVKVHYLKNKTYFYDIILNNFPSNPLSISLLDTSLLSECSTILPINMANIPPQTIYNFPRNIIVSDDPNFLFTNNNIITNFVTSFNTNTNYCLALNTQNINIKSEIKLSPNPAKNILNINTSSNSLIIESHIYDINGKIVLVSAFSDKIDISTIKPSIYFIKIKTDKGEFSQKFIKE